MTSLNTIRRAALDLLARREHSTAELSAKLLAKGWLAEEIELVLTKLIEEDLINHKRFIEHFIHYKSSKGFGPLRIQAELHHKGIPEELIEHHIKITDNAWLIEVRRVWQKRFKNHLPQDHRSRAQQMRFLHYRGFTSEQINHIFHSDD